MTTENLKEEPEMSESPNGVPFVIEHIDGSAYAFDNIRKITGTHLEGKNRAPGSVLIGWAAWLLAIIGGGALYVSFSAQYSYIFHVRRQDIASIIEALLLDLLMIVFTLLALGLSRAGKSSRTERALILACAFASAWMNVSAADTASPRSVVAYAVAPIALAVVVDRVVAVIRRHVLADDEVSAWTAMGHATMALARITSLTVLYSLRLVLAPPETAKGLRRVVLNAAPLPETGPPAKVISVVRPEVLPPDAVKELPPTKKTRLLALYRAHEDYGNRGKASAVARELAPDADLQWGTARSYIAEELARIEAVS